jgi:hypothetical protein
MLGSAGTAEVCGVDTDPVQAESARTATAAEASTNVKIA